MPNNQNRSWILPVGSTQDRNNNADPSLHKSDWIWARSSLILLLGVKTFKSNNSKFSFSWVKDDKIIISNFKNSKL